MKDSFLTFFEIQSKLKKYDSRLSEADVRACIAPNLIWL